MTSVAVDPYRFFFPLGVLFGLVGAALWPLHALGWIPYPAPLHWTLMIQGFEHCFILGFLLTAMPSFLHAERTRPAEVALAAAAMVGFLAFSLAARPAWAQAMYVSTILLVAVMGARRLRRAEPPPEEFLLVAVGLALGLAGGLVSLGVAAGLFPEPSPRFGLHMISLGMVLSLVLGVGGLLVPTFSSMKEPLVIPGLARPHERTPRRALYSMIAVLLIAALLLEAVGRPRAGASIRALAGAVVLLWVWKIFQLPGVRDLLSYCLWTAGWMICVGLGASALFPTRALVAHHFIFIGGFGLLTLGIGTRVVIRHGRHPIAAEGRALTAGVVGSLGLALLARVCAELAPRAYLALLGASGLFWILAWVGWTCGAIGYIARIAKPAPQPVRAAASDRARGGAPLRGAGNERCIPPRAASSAPRGRSRAEPPPPSLRRGA